MAENTPHYQKKSEVLYIFGAGGFGREIAWLAQQALKKSTKMEFVVSDPSLCHGSINGIPTRLLEDIRIDDTSDYVVAIGDPEVRKRIVENLYRHSLNPINIIHPRCEMSERVMIGQGSLICAGSILTTDILIGSHAHINLSCTIGHDVNVGDYVTLSPGVHLSGNVHIENGAFLGTGASVINGTQGKPLVVGAGAIVAAGACVTKSVEDGAMVAGVPAIRKR